MQASEMAALRALVDEWDADADRCFGVSTTDLCLAVSFAINSRAARLAKLLDSLEAPEAEGDKP